MDLGRAHGLRQIVQRLMPTMKHGLGQLVFQIAAMALPFVLLPVITRYMPPEQYGKFALYTLILSVMIPMVLAGAEHLLTYSYFKRDDEGKKRLIVSSMLLASGVVVVLEMVTLLLLPVLEKQLGFGPVILVTMGGMAWLTCVLTLGQVVALMDRNLKLQGLYVAGRVAIAYAVSVPLLLAGMHDWYVMVIGQFVASVVLAAVSFVYLYKRGLLGWRWSLRDIREIPVSGGLLAMFSLCGTLVSLVDRLMIQHFIGAHGVGLYAVPAALMTGVMLLVLAMTRAIGPQAIKLMSEETDAVVRRKVIYMYAAFWGLTLVGFVMAGLLGQLALRILTSQAYHEGGPLVVPLAVGMAFNTFFLWNSTLLMFEKRGGLLVMIALLGAVVDMGLGSQLIPRYGLMGAGWANAGAYTVMASVGFVALVKLVPLPWLATWHEARHMLVKVLRRGLRHG